MHTSTYLPFHELQALPCFDKITSVTQLDSGLSHCCYKVISTDSVYFAKKLNHQTALTEVACYQFLKRINAPFSPLLIYSSSEWLITTYIDVAALSDFSHSHTDLLNISIKAMASLHCLSDSFSQDKLPVLDIGDTTQSLIDNNSLLDCLPNSTLLTIQDFLINRLQPEILSTQEAVICHGDINFSNILIDINQNAWLIDYECAHIAPREFDLAMFMAINHLDKDVGLVGAIDNLSACYAEIAKVEVDQTLLVNFKLYSHFINALWFLEKVPTSPKNEVNNYYPLAIEQLAAFDKTATTYNISLPLLSGNLYQTV